MKLKYGAYLHGDNECEVTINREVWRDNTGKRRGYIERWSIRGKLLAAGADLVADLTTKINALITAYTSDGQDLVLYESDGVTETSHKLDTSASFGGVKVLNGPSFPSGRGAEYATYRDYTIFVEAKFTDATHDTISFVETISVSGTGDSRFIYIQPLKGKAVKQTVAKKSVVLVSQDGSAVGRTAYPTPPGPVSSTYEHKERRRITKKSPKREADATYREYEISWHYEFEKPSDFTSAQKTPSTWI